MEREKMQAIQTLLDERQYKRLRQTWDGMNEVDVAAAIEQLRTEQALLAFRTLPKEMAAEVFANFSQDRQQEMIEEITETELSEILKDLFVDDVVDILEDMPANAVHNILRRAEPSRRRLINEFLQYPENSAGSIMTAEFTDLKRAMTVGEAIEHIRRTGEDRETIYTCYVLDARRILIGVVTVKDLLLASDEEKIEQIMDTDVISVYTGEDQEQAVALLNRYDLLSLPVVDKEQRLVGIVTVDDATDVMEQEATEDFEKMAAMAPSEKPYLKTSVWTLARNRIVWLLVLMVSGMITGGILGRYEAAFAAMPLLVTFIPMLTDTGGNAGSQSSTMVIRGLAVAEIANRDMPKVFWKELRVSVLVGAVLSAVNYVRLIITYPGQQTMALCVALTLFCTVVLAKTVGGILPMLAKLVHADPAIMAAPLITTIVDAVSLVLYFTIASQLLAL